MTSPDSLPDYKMTWRTTMDHIRVRQMAQANMISDYKMTWRQP